MYERRISKAGASLKWPFDEVQFLALPVPILSTLIKIKSYPAVLPSFPICNLVIAKYCENKKVQYLAFSFIHATFRQKLRNPKRTFANFLSCCTLLHKDDSIHLKSK